jgi:hypothetical protein
MTIEYALTRTEVTKNFVRSLIGSPKFLGKILLYAAGFGFFELAVTGALSKPFNSSTLTRFGVYAILFVAFITLFTFISAKTSMRSLAISPVGISTQIGSRHGEVPWQNVRIVSQESDYILIARANGNAFFIPERAFTTVEQKHDFLAQIRSWVEAAR